MKKKKVAIIAPFLSGHGGTETVLSTVLSDSKYLSQYQKIDLIILGKEKQNQWVQQLSNNVEIEFSEGIKILSLIMMIKSLAFGKYDDVICLSTTILYFAYKIRSLFKKNFLIISWIHFSLLNEGSVDVSKLQYADYHLAISSGIKSQLIDLNIESEKIALVFNPVAFKSKIIPEPSSSKIKIVFVGRIMLEGQKNLKELFDAVNLLNRNSVEINLYGDGDINECKSYIEKRNISQKFIWHGWVKNPWLKMKSMDAVVLTSLYEGFPMVLLEAASYGIPIISSNCPTGPVDIVTSDNGFLYNVGETKKLADDIRKIREFHFDRNNIKNTIEDRYTNKYIPSFWNKIYKLR